ncbi:FAD dependent oxidoreductase [Phlegmacium glaucopus]|nr:FAD dependent oxidoreductase [Phlegmacium glaucopus]
MKRLLLALSSCLLFIPVLIAAMDFQFAFQTNPDHHLVSLPSSNSTKSFWLDLSPEGSPLADVGSTGPLTQDADICVIGSGITGVGVVWHLVKDFQEILEDDTKMKVVLLEARQFCSGATGRNGGHLTPRLFSRFLSLEKIYGTAEAVKSFLLERHTTDALLEFIEDRPGLSEQVDLVGGGMMQVMRGQEEVQAKKDWEEAKKAGVDMGKEGVRWVGRDEMVQEFGLEPSLGYTGSKIAGHNLWPYKLVTRIFEDAQATAVKKGNMEVILHTNAPVTGFERIRDFSNADEQQHRHPIRGATMEAGGKAPYFVRTANAPAQTQQRRWKLQTPRGSISCNYVVHATNGYAAHLLPFLAGQGLAKDDGDGDVDVHHQTSNAGTDPEATSPHTEESQHPLSQSSHYIFPKPKPRGIYGIIPTRGQVGTVRTSVRAEDLGWRNSWDGGGGGWEYWFPRYQGLEGTNGSVVHGFETGTATRNESGAAQTESRRSKNPLIIFGGGRQNAGENMESGETDDGVLNERVSKALREFLPRWFPGKFEGGSQGEDGWEMEWTGIMGYTKTGDPFVGPVLPLSEETDEKEYEGHYISAGYTGHGMPRAFGCAEVVASMIKAQIFGESWDAPAWLPKRYLTWATEA